MLSLLKYLGAISIAGCVVSVFFTIKTVVLYFENWHDPRRAVIAKVVSAVVLLVLLIAAFAAVFYVFFL